MRRQRMRAAGGLVEVAASLFLLTGLACLGAGNGETYQSLLKTIPSVTGRTVQIWINDYVAAAEALNIARPTPDAADGAVETYLLALDGGSVQAGPFISGYHSYARAILPGLRERSGYDVRDVRASLQDLAGIPVRRVAVILDVVPGEVLTTIAQSPAWPLPEERERDGVALLVWHPVFDLGLEQRLNAPVFDELGRAAPLAFPDEGILSASSVEETEAMIDADLGVIASLWDSETIRALAEGLERLGAYSCVLTNDPSSQSLEAWPAWTPMLSPTDQERLLEKVDVDEALRPYEAFGAGVGRDADGFYMAVVLVHADEVAASENAPILRARLRNGRSLTHEAPWTTWFDAERTVIEVDGRSLLARVPILSTSPTSMWVRWLVERDPLLLFRGV